MEVFMRFRILPREEKFFTLFNELAKNTVEGAQKLLELVRDYNDVERKCRAISSIEHEADKVTHEVMDKLNKSFITPLEREDIRALALCLDTVMDDIEATGERLLLYGVKKPTPQCEEMIEIIVKATGQIQKAVETLEDLRDVGVFTQEIKRLENQSDAIARERIGRLFQEENDIRELIRWKEIYEHLEACADRCVDVADVIEDIVVKNS
jgi:predicted phosphate transport protein (TIGR00153 family)